MSETIDQTVTRLTTVMSETNPTSDTAPGSVLSELVVKAAATLQNQVTNQISDLSTAQSVTRAITNDQEGIIDEIASNYNVIRNPGQFATGTIKVSVANSTIYTIQLGTQFIQPSTGLIYQTTQDWLVNPIAAAGKLTLLPDAQGLFYFLLPVQAAAVGSQYQVVDKTIFDLVNVRAIGGFVQAAAYGNFTSGLPTEDNATLVTRFKQGLSAKTLTSPLSIESRLKELYPSLQAVSIIGAGDPEMSRSKKGLFPMDRFGMADVYVRTTVGAETVVIQKQANLINGLWTLVLNSSDVPGFYRVKTILPVDQSLSGTYNILSTTYGFTVPTTKTNVIYDATDARFTRYQNVTITFQNPNAPAVGTTADVSVLVEYQPNISPIQDLFLSSEERIPCADYLAKAVIPCFVTVNFAVVQQNLAAPLDVEALRLDIFNYINTIPFGDGLFASEIVDLSYKYPIKRVVLNIQMNGQILGIDGSTTNIASTDILTIPQNISAGISHSTTMFFVELDSIGIAVNTE